MPRGVESTMAGALSNGLIQPAFLAQITFNSGTAYIWSGIGDFVFGGNTYKGVGALGNIAPISEGSDLKADGTTLTLSSLTQGIENGAAVLVPGSAMPWATNNGQNSSYPYGINDGDAPIYVPLALTAGESIVISCAGLVAGGSYGGLFTAPGAGFGGNGDPGNITGHGTGSGIALGKYFPTNYMGVSPTLGANGLCGAFTDSVGNVIQPVMVGAGGTFTVPSGAVQLLLGINNVIFEGMMGYFVVTVTPPGGGVGSNTLLQEALSDVRLGAPAFIYFALMSNGGIIGVPYRIFYGTVDKPSIKIGPKTFTLSLALENRLVNLQRASQRRYTAADQHLYYPDDMFFNWVEILNDIALRWGS